MDGGSRARAVRQRRLSDLERRRRQEGIERAAPIDVRGEALLSRGYSTESKPILWGPLPSALSLDRPGLPGGVRPGTGASSGTAKSLPAGTFGSSFIASNCCILTAKG